MVNNAEIVALLDEGRALVADYSALADELAECLQGLIGDLRPGGPANGHDFWTRQADGECVWDQINPSTRFLKRCCAALDKFEANCHALPSEAELDPIDC